VGLATVLVGLFMAIRTHTELAQVIGYLITENGVFVIGQVLLGGVPLAIELGVLLDVLVAGMLMAVLFVLGRRDEPQGAGGTPQSS
jgi:hydrogenase-4 component E